MLTGAESLLMTLLSNGVDVCFANPGTSEMHFVDALDRVAGMRCVLGLFEGTVTGAADGYARMLDRPACTLLGATAVRPPVAPAGPPGAPAAGPLTPASIGAVLGSSLPEQAIVIDESITTGRRFLEDTRTSPPHDWILPTGGSIGYALPCAIGAAVARPDRKVVVLESDGSGLYSPQSLWTIAHENLDMVVLVFANNRYQILRNEMASVGASGAGPKASSLFDLTSPTVDWVGLATALGVEARRAETVEQLRTALTGAYAKHGPTVIEVGL